MREHARLAVFVVVVAGAAPFALGAPDPLDEELTVLAGRELVPGAQLRLRVLE